MLQLIPVDSRNLTQAPLVIGKDLGQLLFESALHSSLSEQSGILLDQVLMQALVQVPHWHLFR